MFAGETAAFERGRLCAAMKNDTVNASGGIDKAGYWLCTNQKMPSMAAKRRQMIVA
jgi:hypothetical protein